MKRPALVPLVPFYAAALRLREIALRMGLEPKQKLRWPVISVGSISTGGAGKTPAILALARLLTQRGVAVDVLSRGYGRKIASVQRVDTNGSADQFGDEPLLIAREAGVPVFVAKRRWLAGSLAEECAANGAAVHLLDDGMQHRQLMRALEIVLVGAEDLCDHLIPAGDLREPVLALRRADVLAVSVDDGFALDWIGRKLPGHEVWIYSRTMQWPREMPRKVLAFCGIARPKQFFVGLRDSGLEIVAERVFRDHHAFTEDDIAQLAVALRGSGAEAFVTTAKDLARLGIKTQTLAKVAPVLPVTLTFRFHDPDAILERVGRLFLQRMDGADAAPDQIQ